MDLLARSSDPTDWGQIDAPIVASIAVAAGILSMVPFGARRPPKCAQLLSLCSERWWALRRTAFQRKGLTLAGLPGTGGSVGSRYRVGDCLFKNKPHAPF